MATNSQLLMCPYTKQQKVLLTEIKGSITLFNVPKGVTSEHQLKTLGYEIYNTDIRPKFLGKNMQRKRQK